MVLLARELFDNYGFIQRDLLPRSTGINLGSSTLKFKKIYAEELDADSTVYGTGTSASFYNTSDQTTNYEKLQLSWATNVATLGVSKGGTGTLRKLEIGVLGASTKSSLIFDNTTANGPKLAFGVGTSASLVDAAASGVTPFFKINPYVNQSGTAGYTGILLNVVENATGSGAKLLLDLQVGGTSFFKVADTGLTTIAAGGFTLTAGNATLTAGNLIFAAASAKILPGATSLLFRNTGDSATNLSISDAGLVTVRAGVTITASGLTVTAGGATISAGDVTVTAGNLIFAAASAKILPGATSLLFRNTGDSATNLSISDAGLVTVRAGVTVTTSDLTMTAGNVIVSTIGKGITIKEGSGAKMGQATLSGGTVTVTNANVTASSRIFFTGVGTTNAGILTVGTITGSTSFIITSSNGSDARVVNWLIIEPS